MPDSELSPDELLLLNGEKWKVPPLPGGMSEEAKSCVKLAFECLDVWRRHLDITKCLKLDGAEAETIQDEDVRKKRLDEIDKALNQSDRDWISFAMSTGFEWLKSMYNYGRPEDQKVADAEACKLFGWPRIREQVVRASVIVMIGSVDRLKVDEEKEPEDGSDFTPPESDSTRTPNGG